LHLAERVTSEERILSRRYSDEPDINEAARKAEGDYSEGGLARPLDKITGQLPSDLFLWLAWGSIATSLTLS
jgi:hypothetical protein